jgi:TatD DNase family protein
MQMCAAYPGVCFPMIGLHPTDVAENSDEELSALKRILDSRDDIIAVGEVGIDLYWDTTYRDRQIEVFETQIAWAREKHLPLVIHSRDAFDELHDTLTRCRANELTGVFHCYSGDEEQLARLARFEGFMFGVGGVVTYKKSNLPEILRHLPLERVLLETDSPYLAPVPRRGKRNESAYIPYIAERVAQIYGTTVENVAAVTTANAERLFAI